MSTEILVDTVTTTTDSCQMVATETTLQVTAATKSDNQTTANEAYTAVPPRRTFKMCIRDSFLLLTSNAAKLQNLPKNTEVSLPSNISCLPAFS